MDSTPIPTFSESALESPQPPNPPRRVFVRVRMILAGIGVFCGPCIFYTFGFHYANWHCASWGLVSGTRAPPPPSQTNLHKYSYTKPVHRPPLEAFVRIQQRSHVAGSHMTCRPLHLRTLAKLELSSDLISSRVTPRGRWRWRVRWSRGESPRMLTSRPPQLISDGHD